MIPNHFIGLFELLLLLGPLLFFQRSLQRETQAIFLLITRRAEIALALFALLFFPGVFLHEISHYVMARVLQVRTGRFSLIPQPLPNGRLQLGFVETAETDWIRDTLIGIAPLLAGGAFVAYAGLSHLGLVVVWQRVMESGVSVLPVLLSGVYSRPDFWLWFYLVFAVSSTMMPSASDRRAWLPVLLSAALLLGASLLVGAGPWLMLNLAGPLNRAFLAVSAVFGISLVIHALLLLPLWTLRKLLSRLMRVQIV